MRSLADQIPDAHILLTLSKGDYGLVEVAARQVPDPEERREQVRTILMEKGGKRGEGLDPILRAVELLKARAVATSDPDELCMPVTAALVNVLTGLERERSIDAGARLHDAFVWLKTHFRWPIDVAKEVTKAAAERGRNAVGAPRRRQKPKKQRAGTLPLGVKCNYEYQALHAASPFVRLYSRSCLAMGFWPCPPRIPGP